MTPREPATVETDVDNYRHDKAKRINIPTAENQSLVPDDEKALKVLRYPRNPDLDPQLVWRGKDAEDGTPLEVAAPPIYIQEKIHPARADRRPAQTVERDARTKTRRTDRSVLTTSTDFPKDGSRTPRRATITTKAAGRTG